MKDIKLKKIVSQKKSEEKKTVQTVEKRESSNIEGNTNGQRSFSIFSICALFISTASVFTYIFMVSTTVYYSVHTEKNLSELETLQFSNVAIESTIIENSTNKRNISYINKQTASAFSLK